MRRLIVVATGILLSGVLFAAALPPGDVQFLGLFCFVPLLASLIGMRAIWVILAPLGSFLFAAYLTTTGWMYSSPKLEGEESWHYAGFFLFGLAVIPAFLVAASLKRPSIGALCVAAAAFVAAESLLLLYLPAHLALTQYRSPAALALATTVGVWGVSFLLWILQIALAHHGRRWFEEWRALGLKQKALRGLAALAVLALAVWEYPEPRGPGDAMKAPAPGHVRVGMIQCVDPDYDRMAKWNAEAKAAGAIFVVWPELSAAGIAAGGRTERLLGLSKEPTQPAFITTFQDGASPKPHNAAALFHSGSESKHYNKRKPFAGEANDHQAGKEAASASLDELAIGLNICFDSCYPQLIRETSALPGVKIIALPCMGPESPYGFVQAIHGAFTPFRSAELGVPIARAESSAFSMMTDASGRIVAQAPPGFQGVLIGDVEPKARWTPIRVLGDWILYLCWVALAGAAIRASFTAIRSRKAHQDVAL